MKRIVVALLLVVTLTAAAQENVNLGVIPTPQSVTIDPGGRVCVWKKAEMKDVKVDAWEIEHLKTSALYHVQANAPQAYQLTIEPKRITVEYYDGDGDEGKQYAMMTLEQMKVIYGDTLPCCTILDWPAYRYRGWMDDQSRGPVPHAAYRKKQWETLHALKFNFCNYYTEHTLYQPEYPDLAPAYLADCPPHPDEVINLQLFAHAEKTLRVPFYEHLKDSKANYDPSNPAVYDFLRDRIAAAYRRIPDSPLFIINCDETEQLGTGRAKKLVDEKGSDQVYVDFINKCYALVKDESGKWKVENDAAVAKKLSTFHFPLSTPRVAMWGDIVAKNPAMMKQLPVDMVYLMWAYEPLDSFTHLIRPFKEQGNPFWVVGSSGHSGTMTSTPQRYVKNIGILFRDGYRDGAEGAMVTCWDDNGEALFDNSWHALYWAAEMAWNPLKTDDPEELRQREEQFNQNYERLFYGLTPGPSPSGEGSGYPLTQQLYDVGALMYDPIVGDWYNSAALLEPLLNFNPENTGAAMTQRLDNVIGLINEIHIDSAANPHAHYAISRMKVNARKANLRYLLYKKLYDRDPSHWSVPMSTFDNLLEKLKETYLQELFDLKREYLRLWDQENGEYERYIVCNRYDALAREVLELDRHVFISLTPWYAVGSADNPSPIGEGSGYPMVALRTLSTPLSNRRGDGGEAPIYYTLDGSEPDSSATRYEGPFPLERSATVKAISYNEYGEGVITEQYLLSHLGMGAKITLNTKYSDYKAIYSGGGPEALVDGQLGSNTTYADGHWQGYWGDSIDVVLDFGHDIDFHEVSMRFMQNTFDWILAPTEIRVYVSRDGNKWTLGGTETFSMDPRETGMRLKRYVVRYGEWWDRERPATSSIIMGGMFKTRYLRVVVPNPGPLPSWHPAPGQPSYLFTDEIIVR
ncbi:MAG: chitobiase/beta-hexosaminidase C-terminal domain-containing protein [Bacteroidales bacterium]|nr:chitobiase/beta-hexosaminidase C-terminal domain-containing protein [Bacteroidales bacterium]